MISHKFITIKITWNRCLIHSRWNYLLHFMTTWNKENPLKIYAQQSEISTTRNTLKLINTNPCHRSFSKLISLVKPWETIDKSDTLVKQFYTSKEKQGVPNFSILKNMMTALRRSNSTCLSIKKLHNSGHKLKGCKLCLEIESPELCRLWQQCRFNIDAKLILLITY